MPPSAERARLDALVGEATVDAYDEDEQLTAFQSVIEEHLAVPFQTQILGMEVTVLKVDWRPGSGIVAICERGKERQAIGILDLPLPDPCPAGAQRWAA
ncbi:calcium-binding protein [Nonomuraea guangzhouensis]|uniref:Calcium-binding protein n=1 Tax=Nonomuraea guangzhouensis TaxID=1291555 RepID=A0ABW4G4M9_9ACTN|nr:calcium-binding protein [Nonomuraea guangzhouensis]